MYSVARIAQAFDVRSPTAGEHAEEGRRGLPRRGRGEGYVGVIGGDQLDAQLGSDCATISAVDDPVLSRGAMRLDSPGRSRRRRARLIEAGHIAGHIRHPENRPGGISPPQAGGGHDQSLAVTGAGNWLVVQGARKDAPAAHAAQVAERG